ncbi:MAG: helix-turn-helix domain-containing protein [Myxococcota bacterium]
MLDGRCDGETRGAAELADLSLAELEYRARRARGGLGLPLREWAELAEAWRIAQALHEARDNRSAAARALSIGRRTLYSKLERLGFPPRRDRSGSRHRPA